MIPSLSTLTDSYEDEAARIDDKRKILTRHADFLAAFQVGPSHTLQSILSAHVEAGEKLGELLSKRAGEVAEDKSARTKQSITLRSATIGLLGRFRQALADEVEANKDLPRDLESKVFAYFDQLEANRAARRGNRSGIRSRGARCGRCFRLRDCLEARCTARFSELKAYI